MRREAEEKRLIAKRRMTRNGGGGERAKWPRAKGPNESRARQRCAPGNDRAPDSSAKWGRRLAEGALQHFSRDRLRLSRLQGVQRKRCAADFPGAGLSLRDGAAPLATIVRCSAASRQEASRQEASRQAALRQEALRQAALRQEASRSGTRAGEVRAGARDGCFVLRGWRKGTT